jgi:hypothetical protein
MAIPHLANNLRRGTLERCLSRRIQRIPPCAALAWVLQLFMKMMSGYQPVWDDRPGHTTLTTRIQGATTLKRSVCGRQRLAARVAVSKLDVQRASPYHGVCDET